MSVSFQAYGVVSDAEWRAMVERHGGAVVELEGSRRARFDSPYCRRQFTREFIDLSESRMRETGRLDAVSVGDAARAGQPSGGSTGCAG